MISEYLDLHNSVISFKSIFSLTFLIQLSIKLISLEYVNSHKSIDSSLVKSTSEKLGTVSISGYAQEVKKNKIKRYLDTF